MGAQHLKHIVASPCHSRLFFWTPLLVHEKGLSLLGERGRYFSLPPSVYGEAVILRLKMLPAIA